MDVDVFSAFSLPVYRQTKRKIHVCPICRSQYSTLKKVKHHAIGCKKRRYVKFFATAAEKGE